MQAQGKLLKMTTHHDVPVKYNLGLGDGGVDMNAWLGKEISLVFKGEIRCVSCDKVTKKPFGQGFCYTCFMESPSNSPCILRPELCEAHLGKGRDVEWEERNHNQPHYVYLALSSAVKVGVTRNTQVPTRWIDQGATEAIILAETPNRRLAGEMEVALKEHFTDKTNWQRMLKNEVAEADLEEEKGMIEDLLPMDMLDYIHDSDQIYTFHYPVKEYPKKIKSQNLLKVSEIQGVLAGIKGQYLIFEDGRVINIRSHSGFMVELAG